MITALYQWPADQVAGNAATIGVNSGVEDPDYPAAYLADGRLGRPAKLTGTTGSWVFAFNAAQRVDLVALGPHNLTAATLEGHTANEWTAPAFSAAITIPARTADGHSVHAWRDLTAAAGYSSGGFQYWRLVVTAEAAAAVGELWLGATRRALPRIYRPGFTRLEQHPRIEHRTEFLLPLIYGLNARTRQLRLAFKVRASAAADLRAWYQAARGGVDQALFIPDTAENEAWWTYGVEEFAELVRYPELRELELTLIESIGVPL
jgi:hypothetical protein